MDWAARKLGDLVSQPISGVSVLAGDNPPKPGHPGVLRLSCVTGGRFNPTDLKTPLNGQASRLSIFAEQDTILISRSNTPSLVGASAYVPEDFPTSFLPDTLWLLRPKNPNAVSMRWLSYLIRSDDYRQALQNIASGTSQSMKKIQKGALLKLNAPTPPLPEQRKIADILSTWDESLETLDALIAAKTRQKQALMQQLLTGKTRVKGAKGKWKIVSLSDMLVPITRTVHKPAGPFLAAGIRSHGKGVFLKPDFKPEDIALDELFEIKAGDLIVNITFAWEGAAAIVSEQADGALVSHRFPTFLFKDGTASCSYFRHYIRSKRFVFDCGLASPGGAGRNRVLSKSAFLDIELKTPPFEEQQQIGAILDTADQELTLLRTQRQTLDKQKRGLMQRLLTGKIRVKIAWEVEP